MNDKDNIKSGFNGTLAWGRRPALLVIDFQRGFTEPAVSPLASDCTGAIQATNRLIAAMRGVAPVFFTIVGYEANLSDMGPWGEKGTTLGTLVRNTPACQLDPRLDYDPQADTIVHKTQASAFFGTPLAALLAGRQCDTVVVAGCTTSGCVRASVVDAMQNGFRPFVARQCVADRSPVQHESNLVDMQAKYAEVCDVDELVRRLAGMA